MTQPTENIGAGEGNRTLVISLEGFCALRDFNGYSDRRPRFGALEAEQLIHSVRTGSGRTKFSIGLARASPPHRLKKRGTRKPARRESLRSHQITGARVVDCDGPPETDFQSMPRARAVVNTGAPA